MSPLCKEDRCPNNRSKKFPSNDGTSMKKSDFSLITEVHLNGHIQKNSRYHPRAETTRIEEHIGVGVIKKSDFYH